MFVLDKTIWLKFPPSYFLLSPACLHPAFFSSSLSLDASDSSPQRLARSLLHHRRLLTSASASERQRFAAPRALRFSTTEHVTWSLLAQLMHRLLAAPSSLESAQHHHSCCFGPESSETPIRIISSRAQNPTPRSSRPVSDSPRQILSRVPCYRRNRHRSRTFECRC